MSASLAAFLLATLPAQPAPASADYLTVFAADSSPYRGVKAHTFAALVRIETRSGEPPRLLDVTTISWLPETMTVRPLAVCPEKGRNVPLDETFRHYFDLGARVHAWGPFLVRPELADAFRARAAALESDHLYKVTCPFAPRRVCDCVRAIEETVPTPYRRHIGAFGYGAAAGSEIVRQFSPWLVEPQHPQSWVAGLAGFDQYPVTYRRFGDYTTRFDQLRSAARRK